MQHAIATPHPIPVAGWSGEYDRTNVFCVEDTNLLTWLQAHFTLKNTNLPIYQQPRFVIHLVIKWGLQRA
jgi:hypothetical protein